MITTATRVSVLALCVCLPGLAAADEPSSEVRAVQGVVVQIDGGEVVVDLGRAHGLPSEAVVQLYRRLDVEHPVTGETLTDRFPIGAMRFDSVGEILSIGSPSGALERSPVRGDFAVYEPRDGGRHEAQLAEASGPAPLETPELDSHALAVAEAFDHTLGRPLSDRIATWERFIAEHPDTPYLTEIGAELYWLREMLADVRSTPDVIAPIEPLEPDRLRTNVSAPSAVAVGQPVAISVTVFEEELVEVARILVRRPLDAGFQTLELERWGDFTWATLLAGPWAEPGSLEYFVELVRTNGDMQLAAGSAHRPRTLSVVEPASDAVDQRQRSRARAIFEFVDFRLGSTVDHYLRFESDYRYDLDLSVLGGFSVGFGVFEGSGNALSRIEAGDAPVDRNHNYGFAEIDFAFGELFGLAWRTSLGTSQLQEGESLASIVGQVLRVRVGQELGTRLEIGGSLIRDIGNEAWTEFFLDAIPRFPMSASVVVTNLPVGEDLGVSLNYSLGWQATDWFAVSARVGANARTINHYGFTGGLGTALTW